MVTIFTLSIQIERSGNNVVPYQLLQKVDSDQGLHWLPLIQQIVDISTESKMDSSNFNPCHAE